MRAAFGQVNGGADGLTGANSSFFVGCVVEAERWRCVPNVRCAGRKPQVLQRTWGVCLLTGQMLFHSDLCGMSTQPGSLRQLLELRVFELCADQAGLRQGLRRLRAHRCGGADAVFSDSSDDEDLILWSAGPGFQAGSTPLVRNSYCLDECRLLRPWTGCAGVSSTR